MMGLAAAGRRVIRDDAGFSITELLTVLAILLVVLGAMSSLFVSATKSEVDVTRRVQAQQEARLALERMRHETHRACVASHLDLASGAIVTPAGAHSNVRLTPPVALSCPTTTDPATAVTWCTSGSGSRFALRRIVGTPTTCTGGRTEADYLTPANVFTLAHVSGSLATLTVDFPIDLDPSSAVGGTYRLQDSLVLRNSTRLP